MAKEKVFQINNQSFELGTLKQKDIENLIEVAREWVRNRFTNEVEEEELAQIQKRMETSLTSEEYIYFVLRDQNKKAIGCCAIREPEDKMQQYKTSPTCKSKELINVFLSKQFRGQGLGYRLIEYMFNQAKEMGNQEVIWNSGPRYKNSAWDFYNKVAGRSTLTAPAFYGYAPDGSPNDAPIWRKQLV